MTPRHEADVVVIGAGVMGSATAWALARAGREVLLLDRFEIGHRHGSSHGTSRIFRFSYDEEPYVRLAMEALPLWRLLEEEAGEPLLTTTGGVDIAPPDLERHTAALSAAGAEHEVLDAGEVRGRYPMLAPPEGVPVIFQRDAGFVNADGAVHAFVRAAAGRGVEVREKEPVAGLREEEGSAVVETDRDTLYCRVAVVTAGAWARDLLAGVGYELPTTPTRETVAFFSSRSPGPLPSVIDWGPRPPVYALEGPGYGLKAGEHRAGPVTDPDRPGEVSEGSVARLSGWVERLYRGVDPRPVHAETCIYTNTADERFVLDRRGAVVVGSPCSGHGFKFAPAIGERLAALA